MDWHRQKRWNGAISKCIFLSKAKMNLKGNRLISLMEDGEWCIDILS